MRTRNRWQPAPGWSRRDFLRTLGVGGAALMVPARLRASGNPDVVVIGAGAAGIAAARALAERGLAVRVLEAASRPGGRAFTESQTFGVPFDHGASWITSATENPHTALARQHGFELIDYSEARESLFVGDREAGDEEYEQYYDAFDAINGNIKAAVWSGQDRAASTVVPDVPFARTAQTWIGPLDLGVDFEDLSTVDYWNGASVTPTYLVGRGYGALVGRLANRVPVDLDSPVSRIEWGGKGVRVHSSRGVMKARACIVTVSTGVLNAGHIVFDPVLPDWKQQAINDLPMGLLAKIALQFDGTRFDLPENSWLTRKVTEPLPAEAAFFTCWPSGFDLMVGFVGGQFGFELSRAGADAAIDFARGELRKLFGSEVDRHFVKGTLTDWADNPLTLGAYAAARPSRANARDDIVEPLGGRVFFAGEACAGAYLATCGGAHKSGAGVAERVATVLA
ncbi:MAG: NAD(P)/FAD-dependent oxidoreductase [Halofilum sp. (in: g-proteobacteria)]|nr:NAD(P)/FAD-dependent oxidoreductase [Halofilum sp. (in: g-proteobacteria)]